jgi:GNAT superfamily N-acetyltransferase
VTTAPLVRLVSREDFPGWVALWDKYNAFYGRAGSAALDVSISRSTWDRFFDAREPMQALVAQKGDHLVGLAHFVFHRNTILIEPTCYMQDLFVDEVARGGGIGKLLIEGVYRHARAAGVTSVYWHTHESNTAARKLYDRVARNTGFLVYRSVR